MGYLSVSRAVSVRVMFASHGIISVWRLYDVTKDPMYWCLSGTLGLLFVEAMITVVKRQGKEWKWFCPSVFIYLLTSVPAIWFLELHEFDKRIRHQAKLVRYAIDNNLTILPNELPPDIQEDLSAPIGSVLGERFLDDLQRAKREGDTLRQQIEHLARPGDGYPSLIGSPEDSVTRRQQIGRDSMDDTSKVRFEVRIPIKLTADQWIRMLEQLLLLILILGRWLLPKGKLTHDQLSQLLLVYIGTAADIVEFFEAFKEKEVRYHKILCVVILGIWSMSLTQFSLVLTASRARPDQSRLLQKRTESTNCCHADVFGIVITIFLQDLPFLVLRMLLIFRYNVLSYTNMFFTSKNTLVIVLLIYRLAVLFTERKKSKNKAKYYSIDSSSDEEDQIPIYEKDVFRKTATLQNRLIKYYQKERPEQSYNQETHNFYNKHERYTHKWERACKSEDEWARRSR